MPRVQAHQEMLVVAKDTVIDQPNRWMRLDQSPHGLSTKRGVVT